MSGGDTKRDMVAHTLGLTQALKHDKGPTWDGKKHTWRPFWYEMQVYLKVTGLWKAANGELQAKASTGDDEATGLLLLLFRVLFRSIQDSTDEGMSLKMQIQDDFGDDNDGYELVQYLDGYSKKQSEVDVEQLKRDVKALSFDVREPPAKWALNPSGFPILGVKSGAL